MIWSSEMIPNIDKVIIVNENGVEVIEKLYITVEKITDVEKEKTKGEIEIIKDIKIKIKEEIKNIIRKYRTSIEDFYKEKKVKENWEELLKNNPEKFVILLKVLLKEYREETTKIEIKINEEIKKQFEELVGNEYRNRNNIEITKNVEIDVDKLTFDIKKKDLPKFEAELKKLGVI